MIHVLAKNLNMMYLKWCVQAILNSQQHSISYTMSRNQAVIVEYKPDPETDMFQVGRSSEPPIDFVVMDTVPGEKHGEAKVSTAKLKCCKILKYALPN